MHVRIKSWIEQLRFIHSICCYTSAKIWDASGFGWLILIRTQKRQERQISKDPCSGKCQVTTALTQLVCGSELGLLTYIGLLAA